MILKGKYVCADCFNDYAIREFINSHLKWKTCKYCGRVSSQLISASLEEVLAFIMDGIRSEWINCTPEVEWEAENLGWHGGREGWMSSDFMVRSVLPELRNTDDELLKDIVGSIANEWRHRRRYDPEIEDFFFYRWDEFASTVKYHVRYIYYRINTDWQNDINNLDRNSPFKIRPSHVIEEVLDNISNLDIIQSIPPNTVIWRARSHNEDSYLSSLKELGPPSVEQALTSTRMSPAGIPVFYGSLDRETAVAEIVANSVSKSITAGRWKTLKKLNVLNLAEIPAMPSLFDTKKRRLRPAVSFIDSFADEISRPILKDGSEHIEYIPTQVFTEYVKHVYKDRNGKNIDGILYKSTIKEGCINCVLFITREDCLSNMELKEPEKNESKVILLDCYERIT